MLEEKTFAYYFQIKWEVPIRALLFQFYICLIMLRIPFVNDFVSCITGKFTAFLDFSKGGGEMVFKDLMKETLAFIVINSGVLCFELIN
jgi:nucleoside permease NupC